MDASPNSAGSDTVVLLGLGFTTSRVARRLLLRGIDTWAVVRAPERFADLARTGLTLNSAPPPGSTLVHTIPPGAPGVRETIESLRPGRVVYISSTGVYGDAREVNSATTAAPSDEKGRARLDEEDWLRNRLWTTLVLRPAAIYGPGRGVHMRVLEGKLARGSGAGVVSRIHVDDLAAIVEAGALSSLEGAWPVADEAPCSSEEITEWCARLLRVHLTEQHPIPTWGRRVDGSAVVSALNISLTYPTYESGILASIAQHRARTALA